MSYYILASSKKEAIKLLSDAYPGTNPQVEVHRRCSKGNTFYEWVNIPEKTKKSATGL